MTNIRAKVVLLLALVLVTAEGSVLANKPRSHMHKRQQCMKEESAPEVSPRRDCFIRFYKRKVDDEPKVFNRTACAITNMEERFVQVVGGCSWKIFTKKNWDGKSAELSGFLPKTHVTSFNFKHGSVRSLQLISPTP